jgi:hypothetical protein
MFLHLEHTVSIISQQKPNLGGKPKLKQPQVGLQDVDNQAEK